MTKASSSITCSSVASRDFITMTVIEQTHGMHNHQLKLERKLMAYGSTKLKDEKEKGLWRGQELLLLC